MIDRQAVSKQATVSLRGSCPGKTFLVGEYLAIAGGTAVLAATSPRFAFASRRGTSPIIGDAPAARFLHQQGEPMDMSFDDPYLGAGGFGASTAQFLAAYVSVLQIKNRDELLRPEALERLLSCYREFAWSGEGLLPSGADLVAQISGGLTIFNGRSLQVEFLRWPWTDLRLSLFHTGRKLATHQHLRQAALPALDGLAGACSQVVDGLRDNNKYCLLNGVREYAENLRKQGLVTPATAAILAAQPSFVLASKGCGALGADVILFLHEPKDSAELQAWARGHGLRFASDDRQLSDGLQISVEGNGV